MSEFLAGSAQAPPVGHASIAAFGVLFLFAAFASHRRPVAGLVILLYSLPFNFPRAIASTTVDAAKVVMAGILISMLVSGKIYRLIPESSPARAVGLAGFTMVALDAAGYFHAGDRGVCVREAFKALQYVAVFAIAASIVRDQPRAPSIAAPWLAGLGILVSLTALADEFSTARSVFSVGATLVTRVAGPLEGPNQLSGYLQLLAPIALVMAIVSEDRRLRVLGYVAALVTYATILVTFSRAGIASGALALLIATAISPRFRRLRTALKTAIVAGAIVTFGAIAIVYRYLLRRAPNLEESEALNGLATRAELWHAAIVLWQRNVLLGVGAGNYELELPSTGLLGVRTHANNYYLQTLAEGGIVSLAVLVVVCATSLFALAARARQSWFAAAVFASTVGIFAHQFADDLFFFPKVGATWWALVGLAIALPIATKGDTPLVQGAG